MPSKNVFPWSSRSSSPRSLNAWHKAPGKLGNRDEIMTNEDTSSLRLENVTPILYVEDMSRSLRFYVKILGFKNAEWGDEILQMLIGMVPDCIYAKVAGAHQAHGSGLVLMETYLHCMKHSYQEVPELNYRQQISHGLMKCR